MNSLKIYIRKNWKLVIGFISLIIFYYFIVKYAKNSLENFDSYIYNLIISIKSNEITWLMKFFTTFCSTLILILITIGTLLIIKDKKHGLYIGLNLLCVYFLNTAIKYIVQRPRPIGYRLIHETGFSFPSGHAMVSIAFYGYILYLLMKLNKKKSYKITIAFIFISLILLIGISRIYLGVHFASDVLAGLALGNAYLMLFISVINYFKTSNN